MGIPPIAPYLMPGRDQLTPSVAPWRPERHRAVVLIHDMQRSFVDALPAGEPARTLIANLRLIRACGVPVIYTAQPSGAIVESLRPGPGDQLLVKNRHSAFSRTDLAARLTSMGRDQLVVCGVFAHIGCLFTAADAFARDLQPFLVADAMAGFSRADHLFALDYAARRCAVTLTTAELRDHLSPPAGAAASPAPPASRCAASRRSAAGGS